MYLHLGHNNNTEIREIIGIFDLATCQSPLFTGLLPSTKRKSKNKSCVLTSDQLLSSSIASTTLYKRCGDVNELIRE